MSYNPKITDFPLVHEKVTIAAQNGIKLTLQDSAGLFGIAANPYINFLDSANVLGAELGFPIVTENHFYINNKRPTGNLYLMTNSTVAITIDSSQNVTFAAGTAITLPNTINFAAGTSITTTATDIAVSNHLRIGGPGGAQLSDDGVNLVLANRNFRIGLGGATITNSGGTAIFSGPISVSGQAGTFITSSATDIALNGNVRIGSPGGPQLANTSGDLALAGGDLRLNNQTASRAIYLDAAKRIVVSTTTPTQLAFLDIATGRTGTVNLVYSDTPTFTGQLFAALGTDANPSISTPTDQNTGVKFTGGDIVELVAGGNSRLFVSPTQVAVTGAQLRVDDGTALLPSYTWSTQTNMGLWRPLSNQMAASIAGEAISYWGVNYFGVEKAYVGAALLNYVKNTDNTNGLSHASLQAVSGGPSGGDPRVHLVVNGVTDWVLGIDNSQSDRFAISNSNALGTNDYFFITTGGDATFLGTNLTVPNLVTFAAGTFFTANATEIAVDNHLRIGGLGGAQLADDGTNLVLANRFFRIGLGGATISNSGTTAIFSGSISVSGQTGTSISSTATDIALIGNVRIGSPGGPQLGETSGDLFLAASSNLRLLAQTANTAVVFDAAKRLVSSTTTSTEIGFLSGVTSNVQTQLSGAAHNFLLNSNFDIWQAIGATATTIANTVSTYGPDQWYGKNSLGTNGVLTISRVVGTSDGATYACKLQITTAPTAAQTNGTELYQVIENRDSFFLKNQTASFSIKVKAFGNVNQVGVQFYYATTETKLTTAIGSEVTAAVNTSTFTTITIDSQALGNSMTAAGVVGVRIRITAVSTGNTYDLNNGFSVEQGMVNLGAPATYRRQGKTYAGEIQACQRFYEKSYNIDVNPGTATQIGSITFRTASTSVEYWASFRVSKRVAPTATMYSSANGTINNITNNTASTDSAAAAGTNTAENGFFGQKTASGTDGNQYAFQWIADARI